MQKLSEYAANKIAAAFRLVDTDPEFRRRITNVELNVYFEITQEKIKGVVHLDNGRVRWSGAVKKSCNYRVVWSDWRAMKKWIRGYLPLWFYRLRGKVALEGASNPVIHECLYLFRNQIYHLLVSAEIEGDS